MWNENDQGLTYTLANVPDNLKTTGTKTWMFFVGQRYLILKYLLKTVRVQSSPPLYNKL